MISLEIPGLFGIYLMVVTALIVAAVNLITFVIVLYLSIYGTKKKIKRIAQQLFVSSLIILFLDILFIYFFAVGNSNESYFDGRSLDNFAISVWLPIHIIGSILLIISIWFLNRKRLTESKE